MKAAEDSANNNGRAASEAWTPMASGSGEESLNSGWSALMDGGVDANEAKALFGQHTGADVLATWQAYQIIGDALRGDQPLVAVTPAPDFLRGLQARLQAEPAIASLQTQPKLPEPMQGVQVQKHPTAANDASFRWKMVAMAASVSAVMAVSWSLLGSGFMDGGASAQPVIAAAPAAVAPTESAVAGAAPAAASVIVNTAQGPLIRDARLEALLAEHRQYGGMSALQMPAGFLRNATYDAPER